METLFKVIIAVYVLKAAIIGSEFNFHYWFKYGKKYTSWYFNRPTFLKSQGGGK